MPPYNHNFLNRAKQKFHSPRVAYFVSFRTVHFTELRKQTQLVTAVHCFHDVADLSTTALNFDPQKSWTRICEKKQRNRSNSSSPGESSSVHKWEWAYMSWCLWTMWLLYSSTGGMDSSSSGTWRDTHELKTLFLSKEIAPPCGERASLPPNKLHRRSSCRQQGRPRWGAWGLNLHGKRKKTFWHLELKIKKCSEIWNSMPCVLEDTLRTSASA